MDFGSQKLQKQYIADPNTAIISLFLVIYLLHLFYKDYDFSLVVPQGVYFSQAVQEGVDIGKRVNFFYRTIFLAIFGFAMTYMLLLPISQWLRLKEKQKQTLVILATTGLCSIFGSIMGWGTKLASDILMLIIILKLVLAGLGNHSQGKARALSTDVFLLSAILVSFMLVISVLFIFNNHTWTFDYLPGVYSIITILTILGLFVLYHALNVSFRKLIFWLIPLTAVPFVIFLSGEAAIFSLLHTGNPVRFKWLFVFLLLVLFFTRNLWFIWRSPNFRTSTYIALQRYFLPSVLFALVLLAFYMPFPAQNTELFELANPANSMLRIFHMGQIPFLDYMSSHMMYEQWYGVIYHLIFGYSNNLDFLAYEFFNKVVQTFIIYFLLKKLFNSGELSLLFIACFPFLFSVFFVHIIPASILLFIAFNLYKKQTTWKYVLLFSAIVLLIIWRLDTGSAALFSILLFIPLMYFTTGVKIRWRSLFVAAITVATGVIIFITIAMVLRSPEYIYSNFMAALHYVKANQAHGYAQLAWSKPHQFYIHHFLLPFISIIAITIAAAYVRKNKTEQIASNSYIALSAIFFFILYLANAQRGLVRHSFVITEMFLTSTFFLAIALWILFLLKQKHIALSKYVGLYSITFLVFIVLKFFPMTPGVALLDRALITGAYNEFDLKIGNPAMISRTQTDQQFARNTWQDLETFLNQNLTKDQTFLDFSNTPMLYYYTHRNIPGYFNQNLQNTVDDFLQLHLLNYLNPEKVPVVVFSAYPPTWFDSTDGVPNVMRYYMISEYIFENYLPLGIINHRSVWGSKQMSFKAVPPQRDTLVDLPQKFNYKDAAFFTGEYYKNHPASYLTPVFQWNAPDEYIFNPLTIELPECIAAYKNAYIQIVADASDDFQNIELWLLMNEEKAGTFTYNVRRGGQGNYYFRAGNHRPWVSGKISKMKLEVPHGYWIKSINILKDTRFENKNSDIH